jgi:F0F1-type ATP synthase membrane subunit b/b'
MGKDSKKKLEARLTEADAGIRDLESTRAALTEELRAARERHTEVMSTLRRKHDQLVDEIKRSTQDELTRVGDELAEARAALEKATEENCATGTSIHARCCRTSTTSWKRRSGSCRVR